MHTAAENLKEIVASTLALLVDRPQNLLGCVRLDTRYILVFETPYMQSTSDSYMQKYCIYAAYI